MMKRLASLVMLCCSMSMTALASDFVWFNGKSPITYNIPKKTDPVVAIAHDYMWLTSTPRGTDFVARNAYRYQSASDGCQSIQMLGHSMNAVSIPKGGELTYEFETQQEGKAVLYTAMIPTQPNDKGDLRYQVQIDNEAPIVISLKEKYRSEFWKVSVLRGQALKQTPVKLSKGSHILKVKALDDHIIMDQWLLDFKTGRKFYVIPVI